MNTRIVRKGMAMLMALLVIMATGWALPDHSEARQVRNTTRTNVNRNVNVQRDIDIDVDRHHRGYHLVATAARKPGPARSTAPVSAVSAMARSATT